jgi:hypothetical protein
MPPDSAWDLTLASWLWTSLDCTYSSIEAYLPLEAVELFLSLELACGVAVFVVCDELCFGVLSSALFDDPQDASDSVRHNDSAPAPTMLMTFFFTFFSLFSPTTFRQLYTTHSQNPKAY